MTAARVAGCPACARVLCEHVRLDLAVEEIIVHGDVGRHDVVAKVHRAAGHQAQRN